MRFFSILLCCIALFFANMSKAEVSTLVADTKSGLILSAKNASTPKYPASLTKVMTLYLTFNALENGLLKMDDRLPVSYKAASQPRSKLYVKAGETIRVRDAIMALIIISANDVAVVLAEALAPSEEKFAEMMTSTAHDLGLKDTTFKNASGLHNPEQVTTAQDMAILAMAVINHFPKYYKLFAAETFNYRGKIYKTHNHVKKKYVGAEGLKTGFISAVGYNIISTAKRSNHRLVSVVIGQNTIALRDKQAMNLLDTGFIKIKKQTNTVNRLKKQSGKSALNKTAVLSKPDMSPYLDMMCKRLDETVKTTTPRERQRLMALAPRKAATQKEIAEVEDMMDTAQDEPLEEKSVQIAQAGAPAAPKEEAGTISLSDRQTVHAALIEAIPHGEKAPDKKLATKDHTSDVQEYAVIDPRDDGLKSYADVKKELAGQTEKPSLIEKKEHPQKASLKTTSFGQTNRKKAQTDNTQTENSWGVQVGAFGSEKVAHKEAEKALSILKSDAEKVIQTTQSNTIFRSRIFGFGSRREAQNACQKLKNRKIKCLPLSPVS